MRIVVMEGVVASPERDPEIAKVAAFYSQRYQWLGPLCLRPGMEKIVLGDTENRTCRFCGLHEPRVTFRHEAHAIPEALGNRSIFTNYECDSCTSISEVV